MKNISIIENDRVWIFSITIYIYKIIRRKAINLPTFVALSTNKQTRAEYSSNNYYILLLIVMRDIN